MTLMVAILIAALSLGSSPPFCRWLSSPGVQSVAPPSLTGVWRARLDDDGSVIQLWLRENGSFVAEVMRLGDPRMGPRSSRTAWIGSWKGGHHNVVLAVTEWRAPRGRASGAKKVLVIVCGRLRGNEFTTVPTRQPDRNLWWLARECLFKRAY